MAIDQSNPMPLQPPIENTVGNGAPSAVQYTALPHAEPGYTTTEAWGSAAAALLTEVVTLVSALGLNISSDTKAQILMVGQGIVALVAMWYTKARTDRKKGTLG